MSCVIDGRHLLAGDIRNLRDVLDRAEQFAGDGIVRGTLKGLGIA
jgi:hypothetical protein